MRGVVAAGHPVSAEAGAEALRAGGNAVDAALGALLAAFAAEPLLTGLGAGGYMLVAEPDAEPVLLDFFVAAPAGRAPERLVPVEVSFGDAVQTFHVGAASAGVYGVPAGICAASERFGALPLAELTAPAAERARRGVALNAPQAYVSAILEAILCSTEGCAALFAPELTVLGEGEVVRQPELAGALELLGREGAAPFYTGEVARAAVAAVEEGGGVLSAADLAAYEVRERAPVRVTYRGRAVLTNPPPSAGGVLIAAALARLEREGAPSVTALVAAMEAAQAQRTPEFAARLGSTTHISVLDEEGRACSVTSSNGEGSGIVVPGAGIHLNNMLGEEDLNPLGFHRHAAGSRLPSMMAPTVVLGTDGRPRLALGSAGSNRIRSAILQVISAVLDRGLPVREAIEAPRLHPEDGVVYAEPGIDLEPLERAGRTVARFQARNLFFGGAQAAERDPETGRFSGAGDPRRGGAAVVVD